MSQWVALRHKWCHLSFIFINVNLARHTQTHAYIIILIYQQIWLYSRKCGHVCRYVYIIYLKELLGSYSLWNTLQVRLSHTGVRRWLCVDAAGAHTNGYPQVWKRVPDKVSGGRPTSGKSRLRQLFKRAFIKWGMYRSYSYL